MSIEKFVEEQIRKAMAEGEFDNLSGKGQPIDLDAYFQTPEHLRVCYSILKNARFVPEEAQMLKDIEALREERAACKNEARKKLLEKTIREKVLGFNLTVERYRRGR
jgi:formate dehydrogenase maturation protein FdhE